MKVEKKRSLQTRRKWRIRKKVSGTSERPRMCVKFTGRHIYVQFVDDERGATLAAFSTLSKDLENREEMKANKDCAAIVGERAAKVASEKGIDSVVFDRHGALYHGKVQALADAARSAGLKF